MADDTSASVIPLHQPRPKKVKTGAERAKAYRQRRKASAPTGAPPSSDHLIPLDFPSVDAANPALPIPAPANEQLESAPRHVTRRYAGRSHRAFYGSPPWRSRRSASRSMVGLPGRWARPIQLDGSLWLLAWPLIWSPSLCRPALPACGSRPAGDRVGRLGCLAHDIRLRDHGGDRIRVRQHHGCDACTCRTRDASHSDRSGRAD
jgi:hypothetical protein